MLVRPPVAAACSGARYFGQSAPNWSTRSISDHPRTASKREVSRDDQQRAQRARNTRSVSSQLTTGSRKYAISTATSSVTSTVDAQ